MLPVSEYCRQDCIDLIQELSPDYHLDCLDCYGNGPRTLPKWEKTTGLSKGVPHSSLIDFLPEIGGAAQGPRVLGHERAEAASPDLGAVGPVDEECVRIWMQ